MFIQNCRVFICFLYFRWDIVASGSLAVVVPAGAVAISSGCEPIVLILLVVKTEEERLQPRLLFVHLVSADDRDAKFFV
jgi:hypothetical protein